MKMSHVATSCWVNIYIIKRNGWNMNDRWNAQGETYFIEYSSGSGREAAPSIADTIYFVRNESSVSKSTSISIDRCWKHFEFRTMLVIRRNSWGSKVENDSIFGWVRESILYCICIYFRKWNYVSISFGLCFTLKNCVSL